MKVPPVSADLFPPAMRKVVTYFSEANPCLLNFHKPIKKHLFHPKTPTLLNGAGSRLLGNKRYELTNHLANVLAVVSDRKFRQQLYGYTANTSGTGTHTYNTLANEYVYVATGGNFDQTSNTNETSYDVYLPEVLSFSDYYPFHMQMPNRNGGTYRYLGANGQETQTEITGGNSHSTAEYWMYDNRLGRRWNVDPVIKIGESGFVSFKNNPLILLDPKGDDVEYATKKDKRKVTVARMFSKKAREDFRSRKESSELFLYKATANSRSLNDGGTVNPISVTSLNGTTFNLNIVQYGTTKSDNGTGTTGFNAGFFSFNIKLYKRSISWTKTKQMGTNVNMTSSEHNSFLFKAREEFAYDPTNFNLQINTYSKIDHIRIYNQEGEELFSFDGTTQGNCANPPTPTNNNGWFTITSVDFNQTTTNTTSIRIIVDSKMREPHCMFDSNSQSSRFSDKKSWNDTRWAIRGTSSSNGTITKTRSISYWWFTPEK